MRNTFTKGLVIILLSALSGFSGAYAQTGQDADKASSVVSKKMLQVLRLNELEYIKVKELNYARITKMTDAMTKYSNDPAALGTHLAEIEKQFEANLAAVLKKETLESYASFKMTPEGDVLALLKGNTGTTPATPVK